ncbi:biotin--[acetyl-CoA-carboxylase] ligase [Rhodophyticola porphyridii]|uniref:biotin--[biotin carboxyl-carrier protein] ligase n=1 Tax=Rhodophyticola porphyridii TaxID=1852017 RepID=A0A3L9Y9Q6_9RHOB|nr:biotin--[acetyl-CoA-carboxylase] ligase [Rhodophyticola porphyridii]RMA42973.1 biotin--[acetyl-CoA-carboxylase] ligase [Rhodophyticola porphyridii]
MMGWPDGVGRRVLPETDSTMAEATRIAPELTGPEWILALNQTAARGRRGRHWAMPEGSFAASLVMRPGGGPAQAALRSFVASLALREAFLAIGVPAGAIRLKWPNDVLLNGGKVAGILLESLGSAQGVSHLVIGIGVNLAAAPDRSMVEAHALPPVSLRDQTGLQITPEAFLCPLAAAFDRIERQFATYGFAPIRTEWLSHAARLGDTVTARTAREETTGVFETVDEAGSIVLETSRGRRVIPAAEIYF